MIVLRGDVMVIVIVSRNCQPEPSFRYEKESTLEPPNASVKTVSATNNEKRRYSLALH